MLKHFLAHMIRVLGYSLSESSSTRRYGFMYQELNRTVKQADFPWWLARGPDCDLPLHPSSFFLLGDSVTTRNI